MTGAEKKLLLDIARNTEPQKVFDLLKKGKSIDSVYTEIMPDQLQWFDKMQLPEPWHGHLSRAKIMFIGDNPAVTNTKKEEYPTEDWSDRDIINYFDNYWENYSRNITPLVRAIKRLSNFLIDNCNSLSYCNYINDIYELKDIAVSTDIVHCKSEKNHGVRECKEKEVNQWLDKIISIFNGNIIVMHGKDYCLQYACYVEQLIKNRNITLLTTTHLSYPYRGGESEREKDLLIQLNKLNSSNEDNERVWLSDSNAEDKNSYSNDSDDGDENNWLNVADDDEDESDWSNDSDDDEDESDWSNDSDDDEDENDWSNDSDDDDDGNDWSSDSDDDDGENDWSNDSDDDDAESDGSNDSDDDEEESDWSNDSDDDDDGSDWSSDSDDDEDENDWSNDSDDDDDGENDGSNDSDDDEEESDWSNDSDDDDDESDWSNDSGDDDGDDWSNDSDWTDDSDDDNRFYNSGDDDW